MDESNARPFTYHVVILIPLRFSPTLQVEGQPGFSFDCLRCENAPAMCVSQRAWSESPSSRKNKNSHGVSERQCSPKRENNVATANSKGRGG